MIIPTTHYSYTAASVSNSNTSAVSTSTANTLSTNNEQASEAIEAALYCAIIGTISVALALMNELNCQESLTAAAKYPTISKNALAHAQWNQTASAFWFLTSSISSVASIYFYLKDSQESKTAKKGTERESLLPIHTNTK